MTIHPLSTLADDDVERLLDRAFGADRRARTAYRIRAGLSPIAGLSFAATRGDGFTMGLIQAWPVELALDSGGTAPMTMVGPVAVDPRVQRGGIGRALMTGLLDAAAATAGPGGAALMLVGDPEYYGRFFGFDAARTAAWRLPGPWEARRLLARGPVDAAPGMIRGRST